MGIAPKGPKRDYFFPGASFIASAMAACTAEVISLPLDTAKVRLQVQTKAATGELKYKGLFGTMKTISKEEGAAALWKGAVPGLHRQIVYGGLRISFYEPVRDFFTNSTGGDPKNPGLLVKIAAGITTGALAMSIANPTDLVKIRFQTQASAGGKPKYTSALSAYPKIVREEGVRALWTGLNANIFRNSVINAAELATYDEFKGFLLHRGMSDNLPCHFIAGAMAGILAVIVGNPFDVLKSRMMAAEVGQYRGMLHCFTKTLIKEGPFAFYKGFFPNINRLTFWNIIMFMTLEQTRKLLSSPAKEE